MWIITTILLQVFIAFHMSVRILLFFFTSRPSSTYRKGLFCTFKKSTVWWYRVVHKKTLSCCSYLCGLRVAWMLSVIWIASHNTSLFDNFVRLRRPEISISSRHLLIACGFVPRKDELWTCFGELFFKWVHKSLILYPLHDCLAEKNWNISLSAWLRTDFKLRSILK